MAYTKVPKPTGSYSSEEKPFLTDNFIFQDGNNYIFQDGVNFIFTLYSTITWDKVAKPA